LAKKNYGQYYKKGNREDEVVTEVMPVIETPEVKMEPVPAVDVIIEPVAAPTPKPVTGIVSGCSKLNVRTEPETIADIACIIDANSEVKIDMAKSNKDWFKVTTASGVDGYCMRKFVKI
jgi:uncharacterized protein YgiM (DUF1202 family)